MSEWSHDKFEASQGHEHTISSTNLLCEEQTGRVVAVFYNDYDLDTVIDIQNHIEALKNYIEELGQRHDMCTNHITGNICKTCACGKVK